MPLALGIMKSNFTRPNDTTAYTANDLVASTTVNTTAQGFVFSSNRYSGKGRITRVSLWKSQLTATAANFNLFLFNAIQTLTNGDNGAFAVAAARALIGSVALDMTTGGTGGTADLKKWFTLSVPFYFDLEVSPGTPSNNRAVYGYLQAAAGYAPAAQEVFEAELETEGWSR